MKFKNIIPAAVALLSLGFASCVGDLDVENINPQQVPDLNSDALLNKIYANMVVTGQSGPAGNGDIDDIDEGTSNLVRQLWNANELTTDEAHCVWGDPGIPEFNHNSWSDTHPMMQALYYRFYFGITLANEYLAQVPDDSQKRAEARFMRALYYSYLMDLFGNVPFMTTVSIEQAPQYTRAEIFNFVESELKAIIGEAESADVLPETRAAYGRADKVAAEMLLARIYLNAQVYTGSPRWQDAKDYAEKVINSSYSLVTARKGGYSAYQLLFMGDNDANGAQNEIILPAIHDGVRTQTWGGSLFLIASTNNGDYKTGTSENWGGNHARPQFVQQFFPGGGAPTSNDPVAVAAAAGDDRALFYTDGRTLHITKESDFKKGFSYIKFLNFHADGSAAHHTQFVDTDFPVMRVAEAYLTYAEADARLNGGSCTADGIAKVKALQERANKSTASLTTVDLEYLCSEWSREFGFEGRRRMDLIRFNKYGGQSTYLWEWMGGAETGAAFDSHLNIFPIPNSDLNANSNLKQNPGY